MSEQERLQHEINEYQQRWQRLSQLISGLQKQRDHETRFEEKIRLEASINQLETERKGVDELLKAHEAAQKKSGLIAEARHWEGNRFYQQAVDTWKIVRDLDPNDPQIDREIQRLEALQQRQELLADWIQQLISRRQEIDPIWMSIVSRLRDMSADGREDAAVLSLVDKFLANQLSAKNLMEAWEDLGAKARLTQSSEIDFRALADRMKRGEIVLFLGSDIPRLFDTKVLDVKTVVTRLAAQASYDDFAGSLSMLAEYYQMKPEYGRASIVRNLHALLPDVSLKVPLYDLLACIRKPLMLISAAYDTLLESAFDRSGKKYVLITSLIGADSDSDVGHILLQFSNEATSGHVHLETDLLHLDLLGKDYTVIYKIRGYLGPHTNQGEYQQNAITLSEENYFTFARYIDKMIPSYIVNQSLGRGFWFIGYTPVHWEDRLIANALLNRRRRYNEPAYALLSGKTGCV